MASTPAITHTVTGEATVRAVNDRLIAPLPAEASERLPSRGQVAVTGTLGGVEVELVVEPDGRKGHWLPLDAALMEALGVTHGDRLEFRLSPAPSWPEPEVPSDLGAALAAAPDLTPVWRGITPMARWEWVRWVQATKNPDTRARRVAVSIDKLRGGKRRPCCFDLASCTDPELARSGKLIDS